MNELIVTIFLKQDLPYQESLEKIGNNVTHLFLHDEELSELHKRKGWKHYVFSNLYRFEKDGVYKEGSVYFFKIRSSTPHILKKIKRVLRFPNQLFEVISCELKQKRVATYIDRLVTVNPVIVTMPKEQWEISKFWVTGDMGVLKRQLERNIEKKFNDRFRTEHEGHSFIKGIELKTKSPMKVPYKKGSFTGHKLEVFVHEDELSQLYAKLAMEEGLGEKNAVVGGGFCEMLFIGSEPYGA